MYNLSDIHFLQGVEINSTVVFHNLLYTQIWEVFHTENTN